MEKLINKLKNIVKRLFLRFKAFILKLLFPLYFFPVKLITYSTYYILRFLIKLIFAFFGLIIDCIIFPFKSMKNLLKFSLLFIAVLYLFVSLFVISDYIKKEYGWWNKFLCSAEVENPDYSWFYD